MSIRGKSLRSFVPYFMIAIIIVGSVVAIVYYNDVMAGDIYNGGWESQNSMKSFEINSQEFDTTRRPAGAVSWGPAFCKFDPDDPAIGAPNLAISITFPREYIAQGGEWIPAPRNSVFAQINKKVGDHTYFWDHHVFFFEVKIIAEANWHDEGVLWVPSIHGEANGMLEAERAVFNIRCNFEVDPWVDRILSEFSTAEADYVLDRSTVWSGVMSASIADAAGGYAGGSINPIDYNGVSGIIVADQTGRVNMWKADGSTASGLDSIPTEPHEDAIPGVPASVDFEVSGELQPGWAYPPFGSLATAAVVITYKMRVDVMTSAGYLIEDGEQESEHVEEVIIDDPADPLSDVFGTIQAYAPWIFVALIMITVIVIVIKLPIGQMMSKRAG